MPRLELKVLGKTVTVEGDVPNGPARLDEMLPFLRELDNQIVDASVQRTQEAGSQVSCRKGCSTCCRAQPVPITPIEAYALWLLVESMPEHRRATIKERFADRVSRLDEAGLSRQFLERDPDLTAEQAHATARDYFRLGLVCPFLDDDACGIYEDRPFVCRHYLVTSPAELCADPFANPVEVIPMPATPSSATLQIAEEELGTPQYTIPLTLALHYAENHREELEKQIDPQKVLPRWIRAMVE